MNGIIAIESWRCAVCQAANINSPNEISLMAANARHQVFRNHFAPNTQPYRAINFYWCCHLNIHSMSPNQSKTEETIMCLTFFFSFHFMKTNTVQKSKIPTYAKIYEYMEQHPEVMVHSYEEGVYRVRTSGGSYALLIESPKNDYTNMREPCDTVILFICFSDALLF